MSSSQQKTSGIGALPRLGWKSICGIICVFAGIAVATIAYCSSDSPRTTKPGKSFEPSRVHCLARLEPKSRVIRLSPPTTSEGARIESLSVEEGHDLQVGQIVAVLDTHERRRAALREAEARVEVEQAKLRQIQAGAKRGDIAAKLNAVNRVEFTLKNAEAELERFKKLVETKSVAAADYDQRKLLVEQWRQDLEQAQANLESIREIRDVDVDLQQRQIERVLASRERAQTELDATWVRSPISGKVLRIHARPGEKVSDKGVMEIGQIDTMYVVAEVYESDVSRVRIGQSTKTQLIGSTVHVEGIVEEVGLIVARKDVLSNDPVSDSDARVVEVRIRLDKASSLRVAGLSNARCEVTFED